jgi:hypothetical protein
MVGGGFEKRLPLSAKTEDEPRLWPRLDAQFASHAQGLAKISGIRTPIQHGTRATPRQSNSLKGAQMRLCGTDPGLTPSRAIREEFSGGTVWSGPWAIAELPALSPAQAN